MKKLFTILFIVVPFITFSQITETFDLVTYTIPAGLKKVSHTSEVVSYAITNKQTGSYCQVGIYKSLATMGNALLDFQTDWTDLVAKPHNITTMSDPGKPTINDGWKALSGEGYFDFNGSKSVAMLVTLSGYNKRVSIVILTNTRDYNPVIDEFIGTVTLQKPIENDSTTNQSIPQNNISVGSGSFAFSTSTFDDGWVAKERPDWVQVSKENTVVLIHYAQPNIRDFNNLDEKTAFVWNTLVAPRYSNIANLWIRKSWYADGDFMNGKYFAEADLTENSSGKKVHVVLYKNGSAGNWLEFITPDKPTFENQFAVIYQQDGTNWDTLSVMGNYNKFAVSASDLTGKWTNDFSGVIQYVNTYTGFDAGMDTNSSKENFQFESGNTYSWNLGVASGQVGNIKFQSVKSNGRFSMDGNWKITFSDIESKA
jgi:hypothetical protein